MSAHAQIVSSTPERTRLRVSDIHRSQEEMERINQSIEAPPFISSVECNYKTGSILIHHDSHEDVLEAIKDIMKNLGITFDDVTDTNE